MLESFEVRGKYYNFLGQLKVKKVAVSNLNPLPGEPRVLRVSRLRLKNALY